MIRGFKRYFTGQLGVGMGNPLRATGCCRAVEPVDHSAFMCCCFASSHRIMLKRLKITSIRVGCVSWILFKIPELAGNTARGINFTPSAVVPRSCRQWWTTGQALRASMMICNSLKNQFNDEASPLWFVVHIPVFVISQVFQEYAVWTDSVLVLCKIPVNRQHQENRSRFGSHRTRPTIRMYPISNIHGVTATKAQFYCTWIHGYALAVDTSGIRNSTKLPYSWGNKALALHIWFDNLHCMQAAYHPFDWYLTLPCSFLMHVQTSLNTK